MSERLITAIASSLVAIVAIVSNVWSTRRTLTAQLELMRAEAVAAGQRLKDERLWNKRLEVYSGIMRWAYVLLNELLDVTSETGETLERHFWHTDEGLDDEFDLFAAPAVAVRFAAARALLMGAVHGQRPISIRITWREEQDGEIVIGDGVEVPVDNDEVRKSIAKEAIEGLLDLQHRMREEFVEPHPWLTYRIPR